RFPKRFHIHKQKSTCRSPRGRSGDAEDGIEQSRNSDESAARDRPPEPHRKTGDIIALPVHESLRRARRLLKLFEEVEKNPEEPWHDAASEPTQHAPYVRDIDDFQGRKHRVRIEDAGAFEHQGDGRYVL